jgi:tight adherence protein B
MRELASATGGEYAEASSAARLASVFEDLAQRLAGEYLITYTSLSKLGSDVKVAAQIEGVPGVARASYTAPQTPTAVITPEAPETGWWSSTAAFVTAGVVAALLLALALFLLVRPRRLTVEDRIEAFVSPMQKAGELQLTERQEASMLASAEKSLGRTRWWQAFVLDLDVAGFSVKPLVVVLAALVWAVAVAWVAALVTGQFFLPLILFFVVCYGVRRYVAFKAGRRRRLFADQLVDNLQVIVSAMRAGYSFVGALAVAVDDASEPARSELRRIVRDEQLGVPIEESVYEVARRMDNQEFEHVGLVAALQRDSGGNTAEVLDRLIESVRGRTEIRQLVRTLTAQGRMGGVIVSALPPTVAVILTLADPTYLDPLTDTFGGTMALFGAGCAMVAGWLFIRKIVDIKV